jgi:hypothetical protein
MPKATRVLSTPPTGTSAPDAPASTDRELALAMRLRRAGLLLQRRSQTYEIIFGNQVLVGKNRDGSGLTLDEVVEFANRALLR